MDPQIIIMNTTPHLKPDTKNNYITTTQTIYNMHDYNSQTVLNTWYYLTSNFVHKYTYSTHKQKEKIQVETVNEVEEHTLNLKPIHYRN